MTEYFSHGDGIVALATIITGLVAYIIYFLEQKSRKRDMAKIILQEIRGMEKAITDYKNYNSYLFSKKILVNNSWSHNLHLFADSLTSDEIDKVHNLYSAAEYLDSIIQKISDYSFKCSMDVAEEAVKQSNNKQGQITISLPISQQISQLMPWKSILDVVSSKVEPVYHSTIGDKLRKIAKMK